MQATSDSERKKGVAVTTTYGRRIHFLLAVLVVTTVVAGCAKKEEPPPGDGRRAAAAASREASPAAADKQAPSQSPAPVPAQRKIIVTHDISVEVRDFAKAYEAVSRMAEPLGGYNTEAHLDRAADGTHRGRVAMRVPPQRVGGLLDAVRSLGTVVSEGTKGEDVTEQYYDLETRLRNAKAAEKRLVELLGGRTGKLADVLAVERELTRVRGDVESMEARKRNMELLTSMTTIVVELSEPHRAVPAARRVWEPLRTAFGDGLAILAVSLRYAIIVVVGSIPWLGILAVGAYLRKRYKTGKSAGGVEKAKPATGEDR